MTAHRGQCLVRYLLIVAALCSAALARPGAAAFETTAQQALIVDMTTGQALYEKNADEPMAPSSMSKLMTIDVLFEELRRGRVKLDDRFLVSEKAWRMKGSKMFVRVDTEVRVEDLIRGVIVQSGNDAAVVIAEALAGSEAAFAERLNALGRELGLTNSHFTNATGWPDPDHYMSARDIALVARHTIEDFPEYYRYYSETEFTYNGIKQGNRNPLLYRPRSGADGLKTGHTEAGGYGLVASAVRGERRLLLVVNGLPSVRDRAAESLRLLNWGFRNFTNYALFKAGETVEAAEVWLGAEKKVPLVTVADVVASLPRGRRSALTVAAVYEGPVPAPIQKGDRIATLVVGVPGHTPLEFPLVAGADVAAAGFFGRVSTALGQLIQGAFN